MTTFETLDIQGWSSAITGMRASYQSYHKSDSVPIADGDGSVRLSIGPDDYKLMKSLCQAGPEHAKWMRQVQVWVKITAPLYFWSEFDTYKVGTSANSESTIHTITKRHLNPYDFEYVQSQIADDIADAYEDQLKNHIDFINNLIENYAYYKVYDRKVEAQSVFLMIKNLLPSGFKQTRFVNLSYAVLANMYRQRKNHRLPQWSRDFVSWVKTLPYNEFITQEFDE